MFPISIILSLVTLLAAADEVAAPSESSLQAAAEYSEAARGQTLLVMYDGKVIFERYAGGGAADKVQMLASGSKSFIGIAAAAAVQDGLIKLGDPASESITEWQEDPLKSKITYRQLLTLTSGLTPSDRGASFRAPAWKEIAAKPMTGKPGEQFQYGAYQLNAFAYALERKLNKDESFEAYLKRRILDPLGITIEWRYKCDDGHPQVGGGCMTARDWANFGEFVRLGGTWKGKEVIDAKVLAECFHGTEQNPVYGLTWWLKKPVTAAIRLRIPLLSLEWADVANSETLPADLVAACGAGKQRLYVTPSRKLVIVRQGSFGRGFADAEFLDLLFKPEVAGE